MKVFKVLAVILCLSEVVFVSYRVDYVSVALF